MHIFVFSTVKSSSPTITSQTTCMVKRWGRYPFNWRKYALEAIIKLLFISSYHDKCPSHFRPVAMDNCSPNLRPLQQDFNIVPWVFNDYLPRLLTIEVVWEVIIDELLWKVLKTKICINRCYKFWNGARGKNKVKELVPSYSWLMSSSLCKQRSCCYSSQVSLS